MNTSKKIKYKLLKIIMIILSVIVIFLLFQFFKPTWSPKIKAEKSISELSNQLNNVEEKLKDNVSELKNHEVLTNNINNQKENIQEELNDLLHNQSVKNNEIKQTEMELNTLTSNIVSLQNRKKLLEDMQKEYEGFNGSVKRLLNDAEKNRDLKIRLLVCLRH